MNYIEDMFMSCKNMQEVKELKEIAQKIRERKKFEANCKHPIKFHLDTIIGYESYNECMCLRCGKIDEFSNNIIYPQDIYNARIKRNIADTFSELYYNLLNQGLSDEKIIDIIKKFNEFLFEEKIYDVIKKKNKDDIKRILLNSYDTYDKISNLKKNLYLANNSKIYLLRHSLDDESYVGGYSDVSLTKEGIRLINSIKPQIVKLSINKIYTSDVKRAIQTADIVNESLKVNVSLDPKLRELDKGRLNGRKKDTLTKDEENNLYTSDINEKIGGAESMQDFYNRVKILLDSGYFDDKVASLLVTHRGFINMLYYILNDIPLSMNKERFGVTHASVHELDIKEKVIKKII